MNIGRRDALKGLALGAGGVLLSPLLKRISAQAAGAATLPKRFVFVVESNGFTPQQAAPPGIERKPRDQRPGGGGAWADISLRDKELPYALEPLTPWKGRVTILQGLSGRVCGGGHSTNYQALGSFGAGRGESEAILNATIDGALSRQLGGIFPHVGLGISKRLENTMVYSISAIAPGKPLPIIVKPDLAYATLFGSVAQGAAKEEFYAKNNLLDFIKDDLRRVQNAVVAQEREQLDAYLATFETLRNRQSRLNEIEHTLRERAPAPNDKYTSAVETDRLDAQFDIGAAALVSGLTNVLTISSAAGVRDFDICFTGLGLKKGKHSIGHGGSENGMNWYELSDMIRRFHFDQISKLARRLEAVPEGDGTMLDNTIIVYLSDAAESHHSRCWEWPIVMLGNIGGKLKTGRYIDYPPYGEQGHRTTGNFYTTLMHLAGSSRETFGDLDPGLKHLDRYGPLVELFS